MGRIASGKSRRHRPLESRGQRGRFRSRSGSGAERPAQDGPFHPFRTSRGGRGDRPGGMAPCRCTGSRTDCHHHGFGDRRLSRHGRSGARNRSARHPPPVAFHHSLVPGQSRRRTDQHPSWFQRTARGSGHRLCGERAGHWRCGAPDPFGRSGCGALRRHGSLHRSRQPWRICRRARAFDRLQ